MEGTGFQELCQHSYYLFKNNLRTGIKTHRQCYIQYGYVNILASFSVALGKKPKGSKFVNTNIGKIKKSIGITQLFDYVLFTIITKIRKY